MYLFFTVIGLLIGAFGYGTSIAMAIGVGVGLLVAGIIHITIRASSERGSSSAFDGCLLFILLEGIFAGLSG
ncbi:MAG: hypothetical protein DRH57_05490 [Candidatus Cloacimonadota bacterium]|nr:MAG: hypothetical protein DRH57_05490 [Candidatus Cloacimonadota bacterium]